MLNKIKDNWNGIIDYLKREFLGSTTAFTTWIQPLHPVKIENGILTVAFSGDRVMIGYINDKYQDLLRVSIEAITNIIFEKDQLIIICDADISNNITKENERIISNKFPEIVSPMIGSIDPKCTFDTFVVGNNNKLAHAASLAVAESPGEKYNPLFLYGGSGLGKTHLMYSIAHFICQNSPSKKVLYISAENFMNEFIESIRRNTTENFRAKFRNIDVLLIDDIQFLVDRQGTQEEFFHTYEALRGSKKQIVISSDKPPKELSTLEERLRSRFEWGLAADISSPDFETRMAILRKKEELDGCNIDDEVIKYIASNIHTNIRDLEGALSKIIAYTNLYQTKIDLKTAEDALKDLISPAANKIITCELIISVVAEHFGITVENMLSDKRNKEFSFPRQISMYLCKTLTPLNYQQIGGKLNGKDRTTVMHGIEKITNIIDTDINIKNTIEVIIKKINPY